MFSLMWHFMEYPRRKSEYPILTKWSTCTLWQYFSQSESSPVVFCGHRRGGGVCGKLREDLVAACVASELGLQKRACRCSWVPSTSRRGTLLSTKTVYMDTMAQRRLAGCFVDDEECYHQLQDKVDDFCTSLGNAIDLALRTVRSPAMKQSTTWLR